MVLAFRDAGVITMPAFSLAQYRTSDCHYSSTPMPAKIRDAAACALQNSGICGRVQTNQHRSPPHRPSLRAFRDQHQNHSHLRAPLAFSFARAGEKRPLAPDKFLARSITCSSCLGTRSLLRCRQ
jgi:hypothetical protein